MRDNNSMWKYFQVTDEDEKLAKCRICQNEYSFKNTSNNLKKHLNTKHKEVYSTLPVFGENNKVPITYKDNVWRYFKVVDEVEKLATCNACNVAFSYKSTTGNLRTHFKRSHAKDFMSRNSSDDENEKITPKSYKSRAAKTNVWMYFEPKDRDKKVAVCNLCEKEYSYKTTTGNLSHHLKTIHSDIHTSEPSLIGARGKMFITKEILERFYNLDVDNKVGTCKLCKGDISYASSIHHLKAHTLRKHLNELQNDNPGLFESEELYADEFHVATIKTRWKNLRAYFLQERRRQTENETYIPSWKCFNKLCFLDNSAIIEALDVDYDEDYKFQPNISLNDIDDVETKSNVFDVPKTSRCENPEKSSDHDSKFFESLIPYIIDIPLCRKLALRSKIEDLILKEISNELGENNVNHTTEEDDYWQYFQLNGANVRCVACCFELKKDLNAMKKHLQRKHPQLAAEIECAEEESEGEERNNSNAAEEECEPYTEVVYLEDNMESDTEDKKTLKRKIQQTRVVEKNVKKPKPSETEQDDDLGNFAKYLTSLLKKVPNQLSSELQLKIINLVMTAKLNHENGNNEITNYSMVIADFATSSTTSTTNATNSVQIIPSEEIIIENNANS